MSTRSKSSSRAVRRSGDNTVRPVRGAVINDMSERLGQRRRRSRRRVLITAAIVGCTLLLLGAAVFVIGFSPWVTARQVEVRGTNLLSQDQVREVAAVPIGQPLVRVDTDAVASRVGGLAPVSEVKVVRSWPYTVTITVIERTPVYVVEQKSSTGAKEFLVIDADGTPYTTVPSKPKGMLVATVTNPALLDDLATVISALPKDLADDTTAVEAYSSDSVVLRIKDKQVIWGSAERSDLKAQVVVALMAQKGSVYDVSAPDFPAVR